MYGRRDGAAVKERKDSMKIMILILERNVADLTRIFA